MIRKLLNGDIDRIADIWLKTNLKAHYFISNQYWILEEEIGFSIFDRSGRGASLTSAGRQFVSYLIHMREEMKRAIEQGQNFSSKYREDISISLMVRQAVYFLPEAIKLFVETNPEVQISPKFQYTDGLESFLKNETDILFYLEEHVKQIPGVLSQKLFTSKIYLITDKDDILAKKILSQKVIYMAGH